MDALPPGIDPSQVPLAKNPSGAPPNFVDPPSLLIAVQSVGIILAAISLMLVISRFILGHRLKRPFGLDDRTCYSVQAAEQSADFFSSLRCVGMDACGRIHRRFLRSYVEHSYSLSEIELTHW